MIQDIGNHLFDNQFQQRSICGNDYLFVFQNGKALLKDHSDLSYIPTFHQIKRNYKIDESHCQFLFTMDEEAFFLYEDKLDEKGAFRYGGRVELNRNQPWARYAYAVALHLADFYDRHQYCGRCGKPMGKDNETRALVCTCGNMVFPTISPAIVCAIINDDKIVLTKYNGREFKDYALVAGFCEIGETLEEAVVREVKEEVGLNIKNIEYYGSQPWPYSQSMMVGFVAQLDGDDSITREEEELSEALWIQRDEMPVITQFDGLTQHMMQAFKEGKI